MKKNLLTILTFLFPTILYPQIQDIQEIKQVLQDFIDGTVYNQPEKITQHAYPGTSMYLWNSADTVLNMPWEDYAALYNNGRRGQKNNRIGRIVDININQDVAFAKMEVDIPYFGRRFYDFVLLKKIEETWQFVAKATSSEPLFQLERKKAIRRPEKDTIVTGLAKPWSMQFLNPEEVLLAEKEGGLWKINLRSGEKSEIKDLPTDIGKAFRISINDHPPLAFPKGMDNKISAGNLGLFQVLLDPYFDENHWIYLSYSSVNDRNEHALKIIRAQLIENRLVNIETILLAGPYSSGIWHFGGGMVFGKDGLLYIATGERNFYETSNPTLPLAQDPSDYRGKIFRINKDGSIPNDNPFISDNALPGIYALGIRATQGMCLRRGTDEIWFTDHGTNQGDEINKLDPGGNYGWPYVTTGTYRTDDFKPTVPNDVTFINPIFYWDKTVAPTGLLFYKGEQFPAWKGQLLITGLSKGNFWNINLKNENVLSAQELFLDSRVRARNIVESPYGELYLLTDEEDGKIIKIK